MSKVRTRIAPSPTGDNLHIGNAYTALINYVFAKQQNGRFIVRIEDTDRARFVEGSEERILDSLAWLGITPDEGTRAGGPFAPYRQSERLEMYKTYAEELVEKGFAYYCFCTQERLEDMRKHQEAKHMAPMYDGTCRELNTQHSKRKVAQGERCVIRLKVPHENVTAFRDLIRGDITFENKCIDDQVLLKSDGFPTYHLGVVVDDHIMEISHIIRGEEWISSTPKHILLYNAFGWTPPLFAHVPLLRNPDKSKLSKRKNPVWVSWYREQGFLPEALCNYLATLAWEFPGGREFFSIEEMTEEFQLEDIQTTAPIFNQDKLRWMNGEYIRRKSDQELKKLVYQHVNMLTHEHGQLVDMILPLVKERMKTLNEFWPLAGFFFTRPREYERTVDKEMLAIAVKSLRDCKWSHNAMEQAIRGKSDIAGVKAKDVFMELRVAVTGKTVGPPLLESLIILGKNGTLERLGRIR